MVRPRIILFALSTFFFGCSDSLSDLIEEVRSAAPPVCKEYCQERIGCEWPKLSGPAEEDAFGDAIRLCVNECAWYVSEGAYVVNVENGTKSYEDTVEGSELQTVIECLRENGGFRCMEIEGGGNVWIFDPVLDSTCSKSAECIDFLNIDWEMEWTVLGDGSGVCQDIGFETVETMFF